MTGEVLIARGRSAIGKGVVYGLGKGGLWPLDKLPCRSSAKLVNGVAKTALWCDCSGFVAWVLGRSRKDSKDWPWWLSTDSVYDDAKDDGKHVLFTKLDKAEPGCLAVYSDWKDADGTHHEGHIAVVSDPALHLVIDCSSSQNGIAEHAQPVFWSEHHAVIFCAYRGS